MNDFIKKNLFLLLTIACCIPVFFLNVKSSHDWGDDFAQYILQARNVIEHRPQTDNGLVFDSSAADYALRAYPVAFPLMLACVSSVAGNSIHAFSYLISVFLFLLCVAMFLYFKKHFSELTAFFLVLIFLYNPYTIGFKLEVLSDLPFSFFLLAATLLYTASPTPPKEGLGLHTSRWRNVIATGIVAGLALSTRGIGFVFLVAVALFAAHLIFRRVRNEKHLWKNILVKNSLVIGAALLFYFVLNAVLFPIPSGGFFNFYANAFHEENIKNAFLENINYYIDVFKSFFEPNAGWMQFGARMAASLAFTFLLIGMIATWIRKIEFEDVLVLVYISVLLIYPYAAGGFRFIFPVFPFLLRYIVEGIKCIHIPVAVNRKWMIGTMGALMLVLYIPSMIETCKAQNAELGGPQQASSQQAFAYIQNNLEKDAVIAFVKPRALSLYTDRKTAYVAYNVTPEQMHESFRRMNVHYYLQGTGDDELNDKRLNNYVELYKAELKMLWQNDHFVLYSDQKGK